MAEIDGNIRTGATSVFGHRPPYCIHIYRKLSAPIEIKMARICRNMFITANVSKLSTDDLSYCRGRVRSSVWAGILLTCSTIVKTLTCKKKLNMVRH